MSSRAKKRKGKGKGKASKRRMVDTWKSKVWYDVYASQSFNEEFIGSVPCGNPDHLIGRTIETILYYFTGDFTDSHVKLKFKIYNVNGIKCKTRFVGHSFTRDFSRSLVRRGSTRIAGIFNITTKDDVLLRVTAVAFTIRRAKASQRNTIRKIIHDVLQEHAKASTYSKFIQSMVFDKIADNIASIANEIYRIRDCKVNKSKLLSPLDELDQKIEEVYDEEDFETFTPDVKKHRKSEIRHLSKKKGSEPRGTPDEERDDEEEEETDEDAEDEEEE